MSHIIADIESPYDGPNDQTIKRNILYARLACRWALEHGYFPYASHLFFTQPGILDDKIPEERELGIRAGKSIIKTSAKVSLFFLDLGESKGMTYGRQAAAEAGRQIKEIRLFDEPIQTCTYEALLTMATQSGLLPDGYQRMGW